MNYRPLREVPDKPEYYEPIQLAIIELIRREVYYPILHDMEEKKGILKNAIAVLVDAIDSGQIEFSRGHFTGKFNSAISRELKRLGAEWDRKQGRWSVPRTKLPQDVRSAIDSSQARFESAQRRVLETLSKISPAEIASKLKTQKIFDQTIYKVDEDLLKSARSITVEPQLTKKARARIASEYTKNLHLHIEDFLRSEIVELREHVQASVLKGMRYETMVKHIKDSYGTSVSKARFLARQENALMVAKFKQTRYQEIGVNEYRWRCVKASPKHPVRPMHKVLDGTVHSWDNPPIVNEQGDRKNPHEDYNCRCTATPLVKF